MLERRSRKEKVAKFGTEEWERQLAIHPRIARFKEFRGLVPPITRGGIATNTRRRCGP